MGCFEVYPSTCWVSSQNMNAAGLTDLIMPLYHFIFLGCVTCLFLSGGLISL
jgi:hypothetical protein